MSDTYNIAAALADMAARAPYRPGVIFPAGRDHQGRAITTQFSFRQLNELCDGYAHGLADLGIRKGDRALMLVRPGVDLIAVVFALVKMGAVPTLVDPGMGLRAFLQCVSETEPRALIGQPVAHLLRRAAPRPFATVQHAIMVGGNRALSRVLVEAHLDDLNSTQRGPFATVPTASHDEAVIAFTSGSTGIPKGVVYQHGMFRAQVELLRDVIGIQPGEVDLALLYIFALFNPALGVTTIIPDMDPTKSAEVNPAYIVEAIQTHGVTNAFGSPTIWKRVAPYCLERGIRLPSIKRLLMAGAPVPPELIRTMVTDILSGDADILTPFGATEAMPLTTISGREIIAETAELTEAGKGMCVGVALPGVSIQVIGISDEPISEWRTDLALPAGAIGEIVVKGPMVTLTYLNRPDKTALAKISEGGAIWHRMGDLGYFDDRGRLWFCGRKAHRVQTKVGTLYPVMVETIFNRHSNVARTALVGVGTGNDQEPVLVVEPLPGKAPADVLAQQRFTMELLSLGAEYAHTRAIERVLFYPGTFPTDVRHNAKIQREKLAGWAATQLRRHGATAGIAALQTSTDGILQAPGEPPRAPRALGLLGLLAGVGLALYWLIARPRSRRGP
ncbi:MAG: fatty acid CoA ligase family protein [Anaerolineae bacterium]|jgi:acyl-coenzyme A synthetase/AMP-(fatty) acid ligase|nr:fatty acid CoA ligase family protein [Anaerolineae bacterium]